MVWRLDRLGRSLRHLVDTVALLQQRGIGFKSLHEQLDTTTSGGKLVSPAFGALAECEPGLIRERTQAGLTAARARYHEQTTSIADICRTLRISRATLHRYIKAGTAELT